VYPPYKHVHSYKPPYEGQESTYDDDQATEDRHCLGVIGTHLVSLPLLPEYVYQEIDYEAKEGDHRH